MKTREAASLLLSGLIGLLLLVSVASARDSSDLESDYVNKVLTLRHFYRGDRPAFAADGTLIGTAELGPWTVAGKVRVESIEVSVQSLRITGRRVCVVFDREGKPYRDVVDLIDEAESNPEERKKLEEVFLNRKLTIEIALDAAQPEDLASKSAMEAVFVKPGESIAGVVPDYWQEYFEKVDGQPIPVPHSTEKVLRVGPGVSPPRAVYDPNPEFSEDARLAKFHGTVTLSLIVDASGKVVDVRITTPLGLGLDEKAVEAVRTWKFEPAKIADEAVPVQIGVETDFHLY